MAKYIPRLNIYLESFWLQNGIYLGGTVFRCNVLRNEILHRHTAGPRARDRRGGWRRRPTLPPGWNSLRLMRRGDTDQTNSRGEATFKVANKSLWEKPRGHSLLCRIPVNTSETNYRGEIRQGGKSKKTTVIVREERDGGVPFGESWIKHPIVRQNTTKTKPVST